MQRATSSRQKPPNFPPVPTSCSVPNGAKLWAESDKLYAEGNKFWAEAVLAAYGNITMEWKNWHEKEGEHECHLGNGEIYSPVQEEDDIAKAIALLERKGRIKNGKIVV